MNTSRRSFFKQGFCAVAAVSVAKLLADRTAFAADLPHVDEASPQATGLGYKHDAAQVDKAKFTRYQDGQHCANCQLFMGAPDSEWGGCGIFAGQAVAAKGWCSAWVKKV